MTIRPGTDWGAPGHLDVAAPVFDHDAPARAWLQQRWDELGASGFGGEPPVELGLLGWDLHRTLGSPRHDADDLRAGAARRLPVDLGVAVLDGRELVFLAHLVAYPGRRVRWWARRTVVAMNAAFADGLDLGPRSHPNDGRLDVTDGSLPRGQRRQGRRRARTGTHLPHPSLRTRRVRSADLDAGASGGLHVWLDGTPVGVAQELSVRCVPDAVVVVA